MGYTKRTQIYLSEQQWAMVEHTAKHLGVSAAEVVRRAVNAYCARVTPFRVAVSVAAGLTANERLWRRRPIVAPPKLWERPDGSLPS